MNNKTLEVKEACRREGVAEAEAEGHQEQDRQSRKGEKGRAKKGQKQDRQEKHQAD